MANRLKMATIQAVLQLHAQQWSFRRIARELHIDRETVSRYVRLAEAKPANAPTGSDAPTAAGPAGAGDRSPGGPKPADAPTGSEGRIPDPIDGLPSAVREFHARQPRRAGRSACEPYRELILAKLDQGLSVQRIFQDLVAEQGFTARYWSVRRFVERVSGGRELPMRRLEKAPGEEAQVDFGTGAPVITAEGRRRKTHVFRIVLSHSRKAYSEATFTQTAEDFIRCLENAFAHFGGVPRTLVIDNLKAAVLHPDWFDPGLNPKLQSFAQHYGTVILPTRPRTPRHKGKVERGIDYVQENGLKGHKFASLEAENRHLLDWEAHTADTRIHGTTKRQVGPVFQAIERAALLPLPIERFPFFHEAQRKVSRDGHIEVAKAYYSLPPEYMTRTVWVRWDARLVRIFNSRFEPIAVHARHEAGRFSTHGQHLAAEKINGLERGVNYLLEKVRPIGPHSHDWAQAMIRARGIEGTRVLQGLLSLTRKHPSEMLEKACDTALSHGAFRLRTLRKLLERAAEKQQPLPFLDEHPLIRPLDDYAQVVAEALARRVGFSRHSRAAEGRGEKQRSLEDATPQGLRGIPPPWTGYPLSGCSPAEPDSVSPDDPSVIPPSSCHQFPSPQE